MRHRAHLEAGAAQRGGVGQRVDLLVRRRRPQQRVEDRADRAGVDRAVGVAAGALVDRAHVEAGRAADAAQRLAADLVGQRAGAAVVEQHDVHLLRAVAGRDAGPRRGVGVHPLAGRGPRQQPQEHVEVLPGRHHLLDADHGDQHLGQGQAHPAVALGLDDDQRAGLGDGEVGAGDGDLGAQELLAQVQPRGAGQLGRVVGQVVGRGRPAPAIRRGRSRGSRRGCGGSRAPGCGGAGRRRAGRSARPGRSPRRRCPRPASASLRPISWVAIDLTLTTSSAPWRLRDLGDDRAGLGGVAGPVHASRRRRSARLERRAGASRGRRSVASLMAAPASRSSSQSATSATTRGPLVADRARWRGPGCGAAGCRRGRRARRRGRPACRRRCRSCGPPLGRAPAPRPGASCVRRPAGARAARRCASGTSCPRRPAPPRRSRARAAPCPSPSRPRCRRS